MMTESKENRRESKEQIENKKDSSTKYDDGTNGSKLTSSEHTSLGALIVWNVSKALEKNPTLDIKEAINEAQHRLEQVSADDGILSEQSQERYLACALLAWQQLGHNNADSLCRFVEIKKNEEIASKSPTNSMSTAMDVKLNDRTVLHTQTDVERTSRTSKFPQAMDSSSRFSHEMGPVVKLPIKTKVVMRMESAPPSRPQSNKPKAPEKNVLNKIEKACCMDSECLKQLKLMDATTKELRSRAGLLAHREAERVELLERAEAAWKDLETGYQRRLTLAEEKEEDMLKQITKLVDERNKYKDACTTLGQKLKDKKNAAEKKRASLNELEKVLCERACQRMKLSEESSKGDSLVTEHSCRIAQLERDLLFKEEEEQRKAQSLRDEVESARALSLEAERALRAELGALRDQIADVSKELLEEDSKNEKIKNALDLLRQEKMGLVEDLEGCKTLCDGRMQGMVDELNNKREELNKLKKKVIECRCKMPVHVAVEVKRTPSFAALCKCTPEDKVLTSCSCTSMRTKVLSNLLEDLFGGLRSELSGWVTQMPCQLLKCLEDQHNWERSSAVKTSLRNFFACVIGKELDIAITTSIEDYHIRWAGPSCADKIKPTDSENENWQERAIECRAQLLASQLAEQLFKERAEEIRAKNLFTDTTSDKRSSGKSPSNTTQTATQACDCNPACKVYESCSCNKKPVAVYWNQTMQDVTKLRQQVEDLKKDYIKIDDLKTMENKFAQIVQLSPACCPPERDKNEEIKQKPVKKPYGRVTSPVGNTRVNDRKIRNVAVNETTVFPCLVKNTADNAQVPSGLASNYWQRAVQDFTRLRLQIEELKKNSIKKEDLKMMENKIAEIVYRASGGTVPPSEKVDCSTSENVDNEATKKDQNSKKAESVTGLHNTGFNSVSNNNKRKNFEINRQSKKGYKRKPIQKNVVKKILKPNKKNDRTYAVNVCLCGRKTQQPQVSNEKNKLETAVWKQKLSKDAVSQMSSSIRQAKPINESLFSQDISARTYSKESEEQSCPSNCICFHKIPSNTSIDKLLETLAKWNVNLDEPMEQYSEKCILESSNGVSSKSPGEKVSVKSSPTFENNLEKDSTMQKVDDSSDAVVKHNNGHSSLEEPNESKRSKCSEKVSIKSIGFIGITDSEYIGTVNLDKSNDEICKCCIETKTNNNTSVKCITSNKCSCEKNYEVRKQEEQIVHTKKENHQDVKIVQAKPERHVLKNTFKSKLSPRRLQSPDKQTSNLNTLKKNVLAKSDYQIKFLGVTLTDANPLIKNQMTHKNNEDKSSIKSLTNTSPQKESEISSSTTSAKNLQNSVYKAKTSNPIPEFSEFSNSIINTDKEEETKRKVFCETEDTNKEDEQFYNKLKTLLGYTEKPCVAPLENSKFEHNELDFTKTSSDQDISKKTTTDASRSISTRLTKISDQEGASENFNTTEDSISPNRIINETFSKQKITCECGLKFDEFKRFIDFHCTKKNVSEDVALDVQSFKDFKYSDESCVCCNKLNTGESKDLEDNAFHLLEEFLKKKLGEFKALSSSYSCIPQEQEEKIFSIILQRVKQLIVDSTNEITCKCSMDEQQSQGSWKRAYGLLQEYIKMKIKKVQCSCFLAEKKEEVLPDVLEKVCQLIENDFKRLKGVYGNMNDPNSQENTKKYSKQVNFDAGVSETNAVKNADVVLLDFKDEISDFFQITQDVHKGVTKDKNTINFKQSMPLPFSTEMKSCNFLEAFINNIKAENTHSDNKNNDNDPCDDNMNLLNTQKKSPEMETDKFMKSKENLSLQQIKILNENKNDTAITKKTLVQGQDNENLTCLEKNKPSQLLIPSAASGIKDHLHNNPPSPTICNTTAIIVSNEINDSTICSEKLENVNKKCINIPYIGYTLDCSCNDSLGACICPKPISKVNTDTINAIWKNSIPDETYFKKISYIIHSNPKENTCLVDTFTDDVQSGDISKNNVADDHFEFKECETTCSKNADLVLIKSIENNKVIQNHATTNTSDENPSLDIVYSVHEDILDSCECSSHYNSSQKQSDSERLKNSLYSPLPLKGFEHLRDDLVSNKNRKSQLQELRKHTCDCEKIPICHVKMLVENIESKLANADCICDSLISKVCPVHASGT